MILCISILLLSCIHVSAMEEQLSDYHRFSIGIETYSHTYTEPGIMENDGIFVGLTYSFVYENEFYFGFEGLSAYGSVDYTSASTGSTDDIDDICFDHRLVLGYVAYKGEKVKVLPYIGIAYRFLEDDSSNKLTSTNNIGYLRESNYYYSPIGIDMDITLQNGWKLHPGLEYDFFWSGTQESYLGYLSGYEDVENDQDEGYGYRVSLGVSKETDTVTYSMEIFYRFWDIKDSKTTTDRWGRVWLEPENETEEFGINFTLRF